MAPCSHWWQSHWSLGLPGAEVGAVMWAELGGELHTDTGCLACHPRSASAGTRKSSTQTWWPPAHGSAASPGRAQTHGQQPGVGPCLRGMWRTVTDFASSSSPICSKLSGSGLRSSATLFNFPTVAAGRLLSAYHSPMWFPRVHDSS